MVLAGIAIHEHDAWYLQRALDGVLARNLPTGFDPANFELHAAEMKSPTAGQRKKPSPWSQVPNNTRLTIMRATYAALGKFASRDAAYPMTMFGAVIDPKVYPDAVQRGYEEVLHKFDEMLERQARETGTRQRGVVVHDRRSIEQVVQAWTSGWRENPGRIGVLRHLADVPMFADSRASRIIQGADFVSWALWRYYGLAAPDERWINRLWPRFDSIDGTMHGLIHVTHAFRSGKCTCPPCSSRQVHSASATVERATAKTGTGQRAGKRIPGPA